MHIYPSGLIGILTWFGILAYDPTIQALFYGPFIVSGVALSLMLLPLQSKTD